MKRYSTLINSSCMGCGKWLCVTAGTYTGRIVCEKCGVVNIFRDSSTPNGFLPCHGISESQDGQVVSSE
jgi:hypothetical protein